VFDQADGKWSTFNLAVGHTQNFRVVPSTSSFDVWLPEVQPNLSGCPPNTTSTNTTLESCAEVRGVGQWKGVQSSGYVGTRSTTVEDGGEIGLETIDLGALQANTLFGTEYGPSVVAGSLWADYLQMSTSTSPSTSFTTLSRAPIFGILTNYYYLASLGLGNGTLNTTKPGVHLNSALAGMAADGVISSLSWGYTAGAYYGASRNDPKAFKLCIES
jgi:hypothetical protein